MAALAGERTVLERGGAGYPSALARVAQPPERLYVVGDPAALEEGIAIVGARKATPYGRGCAPSEPGLGWGGAEPEAEALGKDGRRWRRFANRWPTATGACAGCRSG